jgi:hypothetical protein
MKKLLLSVLALSTAVAVNAQVDTLTSHTDPTTLYSGTLDAAAPIDSGFVAGTNMYGDVAKMQLFDAAYGVTSGGTITGVALLTIAKVDNGGSLTVAIWSDNAGTPSAMPIATKMITLASIDTTLAGTQMFADGNMYNTVAMFDTPVTIPAGNKFWAGFVLPTGQNLYATAISTPFNGDGVTHTGEYWNDATFHTVGDPNNWDLDASMTIYPIVNLVAGIEENKLATSAYPNPASDVLNIEMNGETIESVNITTLEGKIVATSTVGTINISDLNAGMYIYNLTTVSGKISTGNFVKK